MFLSCLFAGWISQTYPDVSAPKYVTQGGGSKIYGFEIWKKNRSSGKVVAKSSDLKNVFQNTSLSQQYYSTFFFYSSIIPRANLTAKSDRWH